MARKGNRLSTAHQFFHLSFKSSPQTYPKLVAEYLQMLSLPHCPYLHETERFAPSVYFPRHPDVLPHNYSRLPQESIS